MRGDLQKGFIGWLFLKKFKSQLFFNTFPEIYEVPKDIFLVFRLYSPSKADYVEKRIDILKLEEVPDGIYVDELFKDKEYNKTEDFFYVSMFSNFGGWFMFSSMCKKKSITIEHSF